MRKLILMIGCVWMAGCSEKHVYLEEIWSPQLGYTIMRPMREYPSHEKANFHRLKPQESLNITASGYDYDLAGFTVINESNKDDTIVEWYVIPKKK